MELLCSIFIKKKKKSVRVLKLGLVFLTIMIGKLNITIFNVIAKINTYLAIYNKFFS